MTTNLTLSKLLSSPKRIINSPNNRKWTIASVLLLSVILLVIFSLTKLTHNLQKKYTSDTGGAIINRPTAEKSRLVSEQATLRRSLPITTNHYNLTYDYRELKFIVNLKPPYEDSLNQFTLWISENYPLIPNDKFTINQSP